MNINTIKNRIHEALEKLEDGNTNDFDRTTAVLTLFNDSLQLIYEHFPADKFEEWKNKDETEAYFFRFSSLLKQSLEKERNYLESILSVLSIPDDIVSQKIADYSDRIFKMMEEEKSVLTKGKPLFEKESELQEQLRRLNELKSKIQELEGIEQELSKYNLKALAEEAKKLEQAKIELEKKAKPLRETVDTIKAEYSEMQKDFDDLVSLHNHLVSVSGSEAVQASDRLLACIERIRQRKIVREGKPSVYLKELESEITELKSIEQQIAERLKQLDEISSALTTNRDILSLHFKSNNELGERFGKTLRDDIEHLNTLYGSIKDMLSNYDADLKKLHERIQQINAEFRPIGIGG